MCWVYLQSETGPSPLWTVGHYGPGGEWYAESDWGSAEEAAARVHYLNGGRDDRMHPRQGHPIADVLMQ
jgi:hypothetical protein